MVQMSLLAAFIVGAYLLGIISRMSEEESRAFLRRVLVWLSLMSMAAIVCGLLYLLVHSAPAFHL